MKLVNHAMTFVDKSNNTWVVRFRKNEEGKLTAEVSKNGTYQGTDVWTYAKNGNKTKALQAIREYKKVN